MIKFWRWILILANDCISTNQLHIRLKFLSCGLKLFVVMKHTLVIKSDYSTLSNLFIFVLHYSLQCIFDMAILNDSNNGI